MAMFDLSLDELREYRPRISEPEDFDNLLGVLHRRGPGRRWCGRGDQDRQQAGPDRHLRRHVRRVRRHAVKAWLHVPAGATGPLPTVVQYHGYSGGRGFPHSFTQWAQAG